MLRGRAYIVARREIKTEIPRKILMCPPSQHHVISGNYRLGELQGALLNAQLERLEEQTETRDGNGKYLAEKLAALAMLKREGVPSGNNDN